MNIVSFCKATAGRKGNLEQEGEDILAFVTKEKHEY